MTDKPYLGMATTRELLAELSARFEIHRAGGLDYPVLANPNKPYLGMATTRELLAELSARFEIHCAGGLDYKTYDPVRERQELERLEIEIRAEQIYNCFASSHIHPWVPGGNSEMQDMARTLARGERREKTE